MSKIHDANAADLKSWVSSANQVDCPFPIQNLPYGVFSTGARGTKRAGVAIGDNVLDLAVLEAAGLLPTDRGVFDQPSINSFMGLGDDAWRLTRRAISALLAAGNPALRDDRALRAKALVPLSDAVLHRPIEVAGFTDFYSSREHATNVGTMFRGAGNALMPNWLYIPLAYNGRASTVVVSGTEVRRPLGQIKPPGTDAPVFSPCRKLDFELEVGTIVGTPSVMGQPVTVEQAGRMIFGYVIVNDWSARDIQLWEYRPLGPFQSKAFATTISPWIVTREALEPFRVEGPKQDPAPLPYLLQDGPQNYDVNLTAALKPDGADRATTVCKTNFRHMYWSSAQQLAHHAISGCAMGTGDLLGSGTISGNEPDSLGCLLELTWDGEKRLQLETGGTRSFIEDGDTLVMTGWCQGDGYGIGFGEAAGRVLPALSDGSEPG